MAASTSAAPEAPVYRIGSSSDHFVREWLVLGSFPNEGYRQEDGSAMRRGYENNLLAPKVTDEAQATLAPGDTFPGGIGNEPVTAEPISATERGTIDLGAHFGDDDNQAAYLFAWVESDEAQKLDVFFGSDDSAKVWVNGELAFTSWYPSGRGLGIDRYFFPTKFKKGRNAVLVKVEQLGGGWGAVVRIPTKEAAPQYLEPRLGLAPVTSKPRSVGENRWETTITAALSLDHQRRDGLASYFPDLEQHLEIQNEKGEVLQTATLATGESTTVTTGPGALIINTHSSGKYNLSNTAGFVVGHSLDTFIEQQLERAEAFIESGENPAFAGWASFQAEALKGIREDGDAQEIESLAVRLTHTISQGEQGIQALTDKRGVFEWAYLSKVDQSGQPLSISIPENYTPDKQWPAVIAMHGAGGDHGAPWGQPYKENYITVNVNGRGPVNHYVGLSEVDVLEATDFVLEYWNIDPDQVHLTGGSMGGYGTYTVGSRHPDRWASATLRSGSGSHMPVENLLHVPTYAIHSKDDMVVVIPGSRAAIDRINAVGGNATIDETDGVGHGIWDWQEGVQRLQAYRVPQRRVAPDVYRVILTATDEISREAYWVKVEEFGPASKTAHVDARAAGANGLNLALDNVNQVRIDLEKGPFDLEQDLILTVNSHYLSKLEAPLPKALYLTHEDQGWKAADKTPAKPDFRRHFPGGFSAMYHGEPMLIVYGTQGEESVTEKLRTLAEVGSHAARPSWSSEAFRQMPYGAFPIKADTEVTEADREKYNLILLGNAEQNAVAAEIGSQLPVSVSKNKLHSKDGIAWDLKGRGFGLLHYNPNAPERLVYWIASGDPAFYEPTAPFFGYEGGHMPAPDLLIMGASDNDIAAARYFDSHWNWEPGYAESPELPDVLGSKSLSQWKAAQMQEALDADFAILKSDREDTDPFAGEVYRPAENARLMDLAGMHFGEPTSIFEITGKEMRKLLESFQGHEHAMDMHPKVSPEDIATDQTYRIAVSVSHTRAFVQAIDWAPSGYSVTDTPLREVYLKR